MCCERLVLGAFTNLHLARRPVVGYLNRSMLASNRLCNTSIIIMEVAGCTVGLLAHISCGSCICLDSFRLRLLLRSKGGLSGSVVGSVASCVGHCCAMGDGGCNGGRLSKHVTGILEGNSASSSGCELAVGVCVADEESSVGVERSPVICGGVLASGGSL